MNTIQVLDVVYSQVLKPVYHDAFYIIGRSLEDGTCKIVAVDDFRYHIHLAVGSGFTFDHLIELDGDLRAMTQGTAIIMKEADIVKANALVGFECEPRDFVRLEMDTTQWARKGGALQDRLNAFAARTDEPLDPRLCGCYDPPGNPIDAFLKQTKVYGMSHYNFEERKVVSSDLQIDSAFVRLLVDVDTMVINGVCRVIAVTCLIAGTPPVSFIWNNQSSPSIYQSPEDYQEGLMLAEFQHYAVESGADWIVSYDQSLLGLLFDRARKLSKTDPRWSRVSGVFSGVVRVEQCKVSHPKGYIVERAKIRCPGRVFVDVYNLLAYPDNAEAIRGLTDRSIACCCKALGLEPPEVTEPSLEEKFFLFYGVAQERETILNAGKARVQRLQEIVDHQLVIEMTVALSRAMRTLPVDQLDDFPSRRVERMLKYWAYPHHLSRDGGELGILGENPGNHKGGQVNEPVPGLTDDSPVYPLDITSMYPSLISAYDLCVSTLILDSLDGGTPAFSTTKRGVVPSICDYLIGERNKVKAEIVQDPTRARILKVFSQALKTAANAMYGVMFLASSCIGSHQLSSAVTGRGRQILGQMENAVSTLPALQHLKPRTIYADTDCIFVQCRGLGRDDSLEAKWQAYDLLHQSLQDTLEKGMRITKENYFIERMLFAVKKHYAYSTVDRHGVKGQVQYRGISVVRSDALPIATAAAKELLDMALRDGKDPDQWLEMIKARYTSMLQELQAPIDDLAPYTLKIRLTRPLASNRTDQEQYKNSLIYKVANQRPGVKSGEVIPYVLLEDETPTVDLRPGTKLSLKMYEKKFSSELRTLLMLMVDATKVSEIFGLSGKGGGDSLAGMLGDIGLSEETIGNLQTMRTRDDRSELKRIQEDYVKKFAAMY